MIDFLTCRIDRHRNYGIPNQFPVKNREEIIQNIQKYNNQKDCFISICEYDTSQNVFPLWFLCDLDSKNDNQDLVNDDTSKILNWCEEHNITYICDESGHKGIHVLMELDQNYRWYNNHFRDFYFYLLQTLDLKTIDSCCCEVRRLCRIPETIHPISGKLCCTLLKREGNSLNLFDYIENVEYKNDDGEYKSRDYSCSVGESAFIFPFDVGYSPCIFDEVKNADVEHYVRWRFVKLLQYQGYSAKEIFDECKKCGWEDFSPQLTKSQIFFTLPRAYTLRCNKQICIGDKCPLRKHHKISRKKLFELIKNKQSQKDGEFVDSVDEYGFQWCKREYT